MKLHISLVLNVVTHLVGAEFYQSFMGDENIILNTCTEYKKFIQKCVDIFKWCLLTTY